VSDRAAFTIEAFLSVPGSRWFVVEPGQTLFLPGHMAHKVVTLENYLGVGSFFVTPASYLRTLERWTQHTPLWGLELPAERRLELVNQITRLMARKVRRLMNGAVAGERRRWGLEYLVREARRAGKVSASVFAEEPSRALIEVAGGG
jgi:hypothetical protein